MKIWKYSWLDGILFFLSMLQLLIMITQALYWNEFSLYAKLGSFVLVIAMITYNIIVVSHLFTHTPWFRLSWLNSFVSMLNTINICQSVEVYHLKHVGNHHRYNNDQKDKNGVTQDISSTFRNGADNQHANLTQYAFGEARSSIINTIYTLFLFPVSLWKISPYENKFIDLLSTVPNKRKSQIRQLRLDNIAHFVGMIFFLSISWKWTCLCFLPALYLAFSLVNIQNYYEHYGANPAKKMANSVSYYGKVYNFLTFNDGFHQEHHLWFGAHWSCMPNIHKNYCNILQKEKRIISPFPAILGFLDRKRPLLHMQNTPYTESITENTKGETI